MGAGWGGWSLGLADLQKDEGQINAVGDPDNIEDG